MKILLRTTQSRYQRLAVIATILMVAISLVPGESTALAQNGEPSGPVYIVQEGDTLWDIAQRFGVPWEDLARENEISDPGQLSAGDELIIPGYTGASGVLVTTEVAFGENLRSLSRRYQLPEESIVRLGGQSLLELAISSGKNPWDLVVENDLDGTWSPVPGDVMLVADLESVDGPGSLPGEISSLEFSPDPLVQGKTSVLNITSSEEMEIGGSLIGNQLNFFPYKSGEYVALQGIHALTEPGLYPLSIEGELANGVRFFTKNPC
jgi:LysM repeat protein